MVKKELAVLKNIAEQFQEESQMPVLVGRRRIGKTSLLLKSTDERPTSYFSFYELVEIKHNPERIGWGILKKKVTINKEWKNCSVSYKGLSLEDM